MKNVLYIGNKLSNKQSNVSAIDVLGPLLEEEGYNVKYASSKSNKVFRLLDMMWACFTYFQKLDYILIDTYSTQNFYYAFIISQLCRFLRLKYISILHGGNLEIRLKSNPKMSSLIFKNSEINVSPSLFMKSVFNSYGYHKIEFIPNTIEIENYKFEKRSINEIKLLWVRSFSDIYNPTLAIRALKLLNEKGFNTKLCMVGPDSGDGSYQKAQHLAKQLNVKVKFTGKLAKSEWIHLAGDYNIFINTTKFDNLPVSVIEAMALGLPIVSTSVGGMPFLINHGVDGLLFQENDENDLVESILRLKSDNELTERMVLNARKKIEYFDWSIVKEKWKEILK